eukprot:365193-Chlamydomonas_euryale.AAC.5
MPDESVVKQLLFAEGLVGLGGVVGRPRSTRRDKSSAALRPVLMSRLAGWGLVWGGSGPQAMACPLWQRTTHCLIPSALLRSTLAYPLWVCSLQLRR